MAYFALILGHGAGWDDTRGIREQAGWDDHAAFMDGLVRDGFVIVGGPLDDGAQTLHLVQAAEAEQITTRMAADPWARSELLEIVSVRTWALWLDGRPQG